MMNDKIPYISRAVATAMKNTQQRRPILNLPTRKKAIDKALKGPLVSSLLEFPEHTYNTNDQACEARPA